MNRYIWVRFPGSTPCGGRPSSWVGAIVRRNTSHRRLFQGRIGVLRVAVNHLSGVRIPALEPGGCDRLTGGRHRRSPKGWHGDVVKRDNLCFARRCWGFDSSHLHRRVPKRLTGTGCKPVVKATAVRIRPLRPVLALSTSPRGFLGPTGQAEERCQDMTRWPSR